MIGASPHQIVTFCRTGDGVNLAVATSGNGPPLVKAANWLNHIEFDWQSPVWVPLLTRLSSRYRLVRYDERGTGLSDWSVADISVEGFVRDLEAVVDALGLERFALFGISQGVAVSIAYATRHPERCHGWCCAGDIRRAGASAVGRKQSRSARRCWRWCARAGGRTTPRSGRSSRRCSFPERRSRRCSGSTTCSAYRPRRRTPYGCKAYSGTSTWPTCRRRYRYRRWFCTAATTL